MSAAKPVALAPFEPANAPLLAEWLTRPHVARWHPEPDAWVDDALNPPPDGAQALIVLGARPIGYLRWRTVSRETLSTPSGCPKFPPARSTSTS